MLRLWSLTRAVLQDLFLLLSFCNVQASYRFLFVVPVIAYQRCGSGETLCYSVCIVSTLLHYLTPITIKACDHLTVVIGVFFSPCL